MFLLAIKAVKLLRNKIILRLLKGVLLNILFEHIVDLPPTIFDIALLNLQRLHFRFELLLCLVDEIVIGSLGDLFLLVVFGDGLDFLADLFLDLFLTLFEYLRHAEWVFLQGAGGWVLDVVVALYALDGGDFVSGGFLYYPDCLEGFVAGGWLECFGL